MYMMKCPSSCHQTFDKKIISCSSVQTWLLLLFLRGEMVDNYNYNYYCFYNCYNTTFVLNWKIFFSWFLILQLWRQRNGDSPGSSAGMNQRVGGSESPQTTHCAPLHSSHRSSLFRRVIWMLRMGFDRAGRSCASLNASHSRGRPPYIVRGYHITIHFIVGQWVRVVWMAEYNTEAWWERTPTAVTVCDGQCSSLKEKVCSSADDFIHTYY